MPLLNRKGFLLTTTHAETAAQSSILGFGSASLFVGGALEKEVPFVWLLVQPERLRQAPKILLKMR
jgi:hypothetical protein